MLLLLVVLGVANVTFDVGAAVLIFIVLVVGSEFAPARSI